MVEGEHGDDPSCRPNQVLAISLPHPILDSARWEPVLGVVRNRLLTPVGLRAQRFLEGFVPLGRIAQAWSVAEVLRCWVKTAD